MNTPIIKAGEITVGHVDVIQAQPAVPVTLTAATVGSIPPPIPEGTHLFQGAPDARQSDQVDMPTSRFRPRYRALTEAEKALHDAIKEKAAELETLFNQVTAGNPTAGREVALGMTKLEEAVIWAVKGLTK